MLITDFYKSAGGDYSEVLARLASEKMITKFIFKFKNDKSFITLCEAMNNRDTDAAFRASHTLKGICSTLGFKNLFTSSSQLTEGLRNCKIEDFENNIEYFKSVQKNYTELINLINSLDF